MLIGILQTGAAPADLKAEQGDYPDFFERLLADRGLEFRRFDVENLDFPASVHDCDGWLITGSRHGAYEAHAFIPPLEDFIRSAWDAQVPMVGICFGHQIIAQAMGGRVQKHPGGWSIGPTDYDFEGEKVTLNAWHQDQVVELPDHAQVVGTNAFCENAALLYDDRIFTLQAHPEFDDRFTEGLMRTRAPGVVPEPLIAAAKDRLGTPLSQPGLSARIANFFLSHQDRASAKSA